MLWLKALCEDLLGKRLKIQMHNKLIINMMNKLNFYEFDNT